MSAVRQVYAARFLVLLVTALGAGLACAQSDPFIDTLPVAGPAVGYLLRFERSTYRGAEGGADHLPLYFYEGRRAYLHGTRAGLKFGEGDWRLDTFIAYRFEGFTHDRRPASAAGLDLAATLYADYAVTESWHILGGVGATRRSHEITASPLAQGGLDAQTFIGFMYDFSPKRTRWAPESRPLIAKVLYGNSSDCDMLQIMRLSCTTRHTVDNTDIAALHVGRKLIEHAGGWPIDLAGFVGIQRHFEKSYQDDFWSVMAFIKVYWYGFGWERWGLHTRFGMGGGLSYSEQISQMELRDQGRRGRGNWKLLNYLDPSFDVRVARDTYVGVGVSHRSGAFGKSQFFGSVNGGSNYIYLSLETTF